MSTIELKDDLSTKILLYGVKHSRFTSSDVANDLGIDHGYSCQKLKNMTDRKMLIRDRSESGRCRYLYSRSTILDRFIGGGGES